MAKRTQQRIARGFEKLQDRVGSLQTKFEEADGLVRGSAAHDGGLDLSQLQDRLREVFLQEAKSFEEYLFEAVQQVFDEVENGLQVDEHTSEDLDDVTAEIATDLSELYDAIGDVQDDVAAELEA